MVLLCQLLRRHVKTCTISWYVRKSQQTKPLFFYERKFFPLALGLPSSSPALCRISMQFMCIIPFKSPEWCFRSTDGTSCQVTLFHRGHPTKKILENAERESDLKKKRDEIHNWATVSITVAAAANSIPVIACLSNAVIIRQYIFWKYIYTKVVLFYPDISKCKM